MLGNGDGSGGGQRDEIDRELDRLDSTVIALTVEREIIGALSYQVGDDREIGVLLAGQDAQAGADLAAAYGHQTKLLELRQQTFQEFPGGGMMFGLGALGVIPAIIVTALAAVAAYIAYVLNAMDIRRNDRQTVRERLVSAGQAPASILQEEPGVLAGITGAIGTAGVWVAVAIGLYALSGRRARR